MRDDDTHTSDQYHWHVAAIRKITSRFLAGEISATEKQRLIVAENQRYYAGQAPPRLVSARRT